MTISEISEFQSFKCDVHHYDVRGVASASMASNCQLAKNIDRCIVSTDSEEIVDVARNFGADVPFLRHAEYASDTPKDIEFFQHDNEFPYSQSQSFSI